MSKRSAAILTAFLFAGTLQLHAQETTAGVYGTVQDSSGAVIPGAEVVLENTATGRHYTASSAETGGFALTLLPVGEYTATAETAGFKKSVVTGITLHVNDNRRIVFQLDVGEVAESITVAASAVEVNTASGETSAHLSAKQIINTPTPGRYVMPLAMLMPGVVSDTPNNRRNNRAAVNGVRPTHNAWLLDGGYNIDTGGNWGAPLAPNVEGVAEFRALRGNYSAEFGTGGGSQFNVITKSGTNEFHGSLYYFLRNEKLNARNFFNSERQAFKGNEFGFSFGGPVRIPGVYDGRNKTFVFILQGWNKERTQQVFQSIVPTAALRQGDFSALGETIIDPETGEGFANNQIPTARVDPNALGYQSMYELPNFVSSTANNYTTTSPFIDDRRDQSYRVDHNFSDKHRVMARYYREKRDGQRSLTPGFAFLRRTDETPANNTVIKFTSIFSPTLINDANFTRSHNRIMQFYPDLSGSTWGINIPELFEDTEANYPVENLNLSGVPDKVPNITMTNYAGINAGAPWSNFQTIYEIKDSLTWITGSHTFKFGGLYAHEQKFEPTDTNVFGNFTFDGVATGDPWADFLLGKAANYSESDTVAFNDNLRHALELYANDSWKATRRLTLNLGLRYAYFPAATEADERFRSFSPDFYDPANAVTITEAGNVLTDTGDRFNGLINPSDHFDIDPINLAPRVSFAYDLFGNGRTAVRGGYGLFFSREILGAFILMSGNPPFQQQITLFNTSLNNPGAGVVSGTTSPITLGSIDTDQPTPYTQQWNLNIQHGLAKNTILEVGYSGSRTIHMMRTIDINQPLPNPDIATRAANANFFRPYRGWGSISDREQSYAANYHGLQLELTRNYTNGFSSKFAYTYAKAIDNADFTGGIYGAVPNTYNAGTERGRANFDARQRFIASPIYELPFFRQKSGPVKAILGGWQVSGIITLQTGLPINPQAGVDRAGVGASTRQRPNVSGNPDLDGSAQSVTSWFDDSVFSLADYGTFGNLGRNSLSGPGIANLDLSITKRIPVAETATFEIWAQSFNVLNHTQFSGVGTNFSSSSFGRVTSATSERTMMMGLRLEF